MVEMLIYVRENQLVSRAIFSLLPGVCLSCFDLKSGVFAEKVTRNASVLAKAHRHWVAMTTALAEEGGTETWHNLALTVGEREGTREKERALLTWCNALLGRRPYMPILYLFFPFVFYVCLSRFFLRKERTSQITSNFFFHNNSYAL